MWSTMKFAAHLLTLCYHKSGILMPNKSHIVEPGIVTPMSLQVIGDLHLGLFDMGVPLGVQSDDTTVPANTETSTGNPVCSTQSRIMHCNLLVAHDLQSYKLINITKDLHGYVCVFDSATNVWETRNNQFPSSLHLWKFRCATCKGVLCVVMCRCSVVTYSIDSNTWKKIGDKSSPKFKLHSTPPKYQPQLAHFLPYWS